jgi:SAM-dependent methyltransferase
MKCANDSLFEPDYLTILKDFVKRLIKGELHLPPWWLRDVGGSDFVATGQEFLELFIQVGNLQPDEQILEIGCGSGRMAIPLTHYVNRNGSYKGIDIVKQSVTWCQQNISRRHSNFCFLHADLYNKRYNPNGRYQAKDYTFPFQDECFDFIFLTSVFTHLLPADTRRYLLEIARLLRQSGRGFFTFFLLNETQQTLARQGRNDIHFKYGSDLCRMRDESVPESALAYDERYLLELLSECGLELYDQVHYGTWSGREEGLSYQDILLVRRK